MTAFDYPAAQSEQQAIFEEAKRIYAERNSLYKDNWRRFGWRGCLFRLRERVERAWDAAWDATVPMEDGRKAIEDDLIDLINFAAFTLRAIREDNRDGTWFTNALR